MVRFVYVPLTRASPTQPEGDQMLQIHHGDDVVFAMYDDGNVLISSNPESLQRSREAAQNALDYLTDWIARSCMSSTESATTQCSQEN